MNGMAMLADIPQAAVALGDPLNDRLAARAAEFHAVLPFICSYLGVPALRCASGLLAGLGCFTALVHHAGQALESRECNAGRASSPNEQSHPTSLETDRRFPEAAVLLPITRSEEPELVLTLRAKGLSTHGGEVAFPVVDATRRIRTWCSPPCARPRRKSVCRRDWWKSSVR